MDSQQEQLLKAITVIVHNSKGSKILRYKLICIIFVGLLKFPLLVGSTVTKQHMGPNDDRW